LTAGGIRLAFQYGRRAAQAISDFLQANGPDPGLVMAKEYPRFGAKALMRRAWSAAPSNAILNLTLFTPPMLALAQWIYFRKRGVTADARGDGGAFVARPETA
jgi:flavin-dependent dehydrogenase